MPRQVSITTPSGEVKTQECLAGADIVVQAALHHADAHPGTVSPRFFPTKTIAKMRLIDVDFQFDMVIFDAALLMVSLI